MWFKKGQKPDDQPHVESHQGSDEEVGFVHHNLPSSSRTDDTAPWVDGDPEPPKLHRPAKQAAPAENDSLDDDTVENLEAIYEEEEAEDMSRFDRGAGWRWRKMLIGLVVFFGFLALVSWAGFFLFSPIGHKKFTGDRVKVTIDGPPQVQSGQLVRYTITVKNGESVPLGTANLDLRLPKQFTVQKIEPSDDDKRNWTIGSLSPGKEKAFIITGIFLAPLDTQLDMQAILNYRPADFNSMFQKVDTRTIGISDSIFDLSAAGPERVLPGDDFDLDISYLNTTDNQFSDLRLRVSWPEGFIPESAEPAAANEDLSEWQLADLPANSEGRIKVRGSFSSDAKGKATVGMELGLSGEQDSFGLQKSSEFSLDVIEGELVLGLVLNGKSSDQSAVFGDTLHYSLSWRNTGGSTLDNVVLSATVEATPTASVVDWNGLKDLEEGERIENTLTWDMDQVSMLENIAAGEEGAIDFDLPLVSAPIAGLDETNYEVTAWVEAAIEAIDGQEVGRVVKTPTLKATLSSDAVLLAEARWFSTDGLPIGSGPLPPVVGQPTTYHVDWMIGNSLHDLSDLRLSARLPDNVLWTGKSTVDAGDLRFDAAESKIIWTLNWLPTDVQNIRIGFDLALTPTANQQGKTPTVIDAAILEARDKVNNNPIILSAPPLTTSLPDDSLASGKGKVQ